MIGVELIKKNMPVHILTIVTNKDNTIVYHDYHYSL